MADMPKSMIHPVKSKAETKDGWTYTLEDWERSKKNAIVRCCPCGCHMFYVYSCHREYETWVECMRCGAKDVVHDG